MANKMNGCRQGLVKGMAFAWLGLMCIPGAQMARGEAMLQFFNASWNEIADKVPELAEAGYTSIWLPPPAKANGGYSVGYDLFDPFDLGGKDQRGTIATRYGTEADLHNLVELLHRFGMRVYFDNIMNHRAYDVPGYNESTPIDVFPGMVAEDFHLKKTSDGFYRKWDNTRDWNDAWQVMHLGLSDLLDIAHETPNQNFGFNEGDWHEKPSIVRHPNHPEYYDRMPNTNVPPSEWNVWDWSGNTNANVYVGFGVGNGITTNMIAEYPEFFQEDVGAYLCRSARWMMETTKADGFRLDAVKHVPDYFFGDTWSENKDSSHEGYLGNIQWQYNMTHGFSDWGNHRDTVFDEDLPRDDALVFGEHLGSPPGYDGYVAAGMRLVDNDLRNQLNWRFSANDLWGYEHAGSGGFSSGVGIMHAQSHDNDYVDRKELHHAYYYLRRGIGLLYTDGNTHAETLSGSGGAFPRWASTAYLGQWGQPHIPELLNIHQNFAWYDHTPQWGDGSCIAWQRGGDGDWASMLVVFNSEWDAWRTIPTHGSFWEGAYLYNYARAYTPHRAGVDDWPEVEYSYAGELTSVEMPPNSYSVWGWKNPDPSALWDGDVVTIYDDGRMADMMWVERKDGPDGDEAFNPYNLNPADFGLTNFPPYTYYMPIPRVTGGTNVTFGVRVDGSAENLLLRLDGGIDLNGLTHEGGDLRDHPPALSDDRYLGFEECYPFFFQRIWPEKFASSDTVSNKIASMGAATYSVTVGDTTVTETASTAVNDFGSSMGELSWVYHEPAGMTDAANPVAPASRMAPRNIPAGDTDMSLMASAEWIGASYINVNGVWYKGDDEAPWTAQGGNFDAAAITASELRIGGQVQTWGEGDGKENPATLAYEILDSGHTAVLNGTVTLYWYEYKNNNNWFESRTGNSGAFQLKNVDLSALTEEETYTLSVKFSAASATGTILDDHSGAGYNASFTYSSATPDPDEGIITNQFYMTATSIVVWAKTPKVDGTIASLYYTLDGTSWPEGAGGFPANNATKVVAGTYSHTGSDDASDWWMFDIPRPATGVVLRYKIGAARRQGSAAGWETVWPGSAHDVYRKKQMMSQWMVDQQNLKTKQYHLHNDYNSWTTNGLADGFHFLSARPFLKRDDGAPVYNTFRQTFYLDTETPQGEILYPSATETQIGGSEYGLVLRTDQTVREVWYHITDSADSNDGVGNGLVSNEVVWAQASPVKAWNTEMALNTDYPKVWRFTYSRIPSSGQATIRIRLREWSSTAATNWSKSSPLLDDAEAMHFTELTRTLNTRGDPEDFYFEWPSQDGDMVEAGWRIRLKYTSKMTSGLSDEDLFACFKVYVNSTSNGSMERGEQIDPLLLNFQNEWDWGVEGAGENTISFEMPNVYNGQNGWLYGVRVEFDNANKYGTFSKAATRLVQHRGPLLPTVIISTPPETDSDGAKYIIQMNDLPASEIAANPALRQTPLVILTDNVATNLDITFVSPTGYVPVLSPPVIETNGSKLTWTYHWTVNEPGSYRFNATVMVDTNGTELSAASHTATRNATVQFIQLVETTNSLTLDWDDDGMMNMAEENAYSLPESGAEYWTQDEVFMYRAGGKTRSNSPDTDTDGLPDALELGFRTPMTGGDTDVSADTNGDGWPNFIADLDPPFYNTLDNYGKVPGIDAAGTGADRTKLVRGSVTDPNVIDSDYDGLPDAIEDANRNGWVDGDGNPLLPGQSRDDRGAWPNGKMDDGETWEETSPNIADSDGDGLSDGYGEDINFNGRTDMFLLYEDGRRVEITLDMYTDLGIGVDNHSTTYSSYAGTPVPYSSRAINYAALFGKFAVTADVFTHVGIGPGSLQTNGWPRIIITETDPLNADTDGDGLPDGWETRYGLDPLDNGVYDFRTGGAGHVDNGATGNPDVDTYLDSDGLIQPYTNLKEFQNGTNPTLPDSANNPGGEGALNIGRGEEIGSVNGTPYYREFMDWTMDDLLALDDYDQGGNSSDIFRKGDGFDSSRDMVAFYFRDGGNPGEGGDDTLYFRVDFDDLKAHAEENALNVYVAINYGNYGVGELNFPDEVDAGSKMRWNACIAIYDSAQGTLYVDTNPGVNTESIGGSLSAAGVVSAPQDILGTYFDSELDTVAFSIRRGALLEAGWNGIPDQLLFQVFTTRDFTGNDGTGGGDNPGRNDFADTIGDDWLCSDYYSNQDYISQNSYYQYCIGRTPGAYVFNHLGRHAKVALLSHGNQAVEPGSTIQNIVDNGTGAGYQRPVKIHNIYTNAPLNLHITPTLAMALEWAEVGTSNTWFSGPLLNEQIRQGVQKKSLYLLGSTFSDHILRYFDDEYNSANVQLARDILNRIYGGSATNPAVSTNIFWTPERVLDLDSLKKVERLGYQATILDQDTHLFHWYGREQSLGNNAYKVNRLWLESTQASWPSIKAFVIANAANNFRYINTDNGLPRDLRRLFLRRARSGEDQISTIFYMWEELAQGDKADAYDKNLRWLANHPWIQVTALENALDIGLTDKDVYATNSLQAHDWVQHANNENYDNWYYGSERHEGLATKVFEVRSGTALPSGQPYGSMTNGILSNVWKTVSNIQHPDVKRLAQQALFASTFETAFHQESNNNLERWSYGDYIWPATEWMGLQGFAWKAQGQTRMAALYRYVDEWATNTFNEVLLRGADVDLDGEVEYIIQNNSVMALFELSGARMVGAWMKNGSNIYQMIGNFVSMPYSGTEQEGTTDVSDGIVASYRTAALTDWKVGSSNQVNALYTCLPGLEGEGILRFRHGNVTKVIELPDASINIFGIRYIMSDSNTTFHVRNGFSPDLDTLLSTGQKYLVDENESGDTIQLKTLRMESGVEVGVTLNMVAGTINIAATDQPSDGSFNTINMRNQAQTRQVELSGTGYLAFQMQFSADSYEPPTMAFDPEGPYTIMVGSTNTFTVRAQDSFGQPLAVTATGMPDGATFDSGSGQFTWAVTNLTQGGRRTDSIIEITFSATDATWPIEETATITIPWDGNNNGMGDDWEYLSFGGDMTQSPDGDYDEDGFSNYSEWVAGTSPTDADEYIGWEYQYAVDEGQSLVFKSVPYRTYRIEVSDGTELPANRWLPEDTVVATSGYTTWTDTNALPNRVYRIVIPPAN